MSPKPKGPSMTTTREAAERITQGEWTEQDLQDVARAVLDPSVLLPEAKWRESEGWSRWHTESGTYFVRQHTHAAHWIWKLTMDGGVSRADSLEAGKAACEAHYRDVVRKMFGVKENQHES